MHFSINTRVARTYASKTATLAEFAVDHDSTRTRDTIALAATGQRHDTTEIMELVHSATTEESRAALAQDLDLRITARLARVITRTARDDRDRRNALALFELVAASGGRFALKEPEILDVLELLSLQGEAKVAEQFARKFGIPASAPLHNLFAISNAQRIRRGNLRESLGDWIETISIVYRKEGLENLTVRDGTSAPFERLACQTTTPAPAGPRVTVLVSADELWTTRAVKSLLEQTHQNLQILVTSHQRLPLKHPWRTRDRRVRNVRTEGAMSPIRARNLAARRFADGKYLTTHLPGTWIHPRTIERQVAFLEEYATHDACVVPMVEVSDDLAFVRVPHRPGFTGPDPAGMLIRTTYLVARGGWDDVSKLSELELFERIESITGSPVPTVGQAPVRFRNTDRAPGAPLTPAADERWYIASFRHWHATASPDELALGPSSEARCSISAPVSMRTSVSEDDAIDIIYATDFRFPGGNTTLTRNEVETLVEASYRVALLPLGSPLIKGLAIDRRILEMATQLDLPIVTLGDHVETRLTIVRHPTVLQFAEPRRSNITTEQLIQIVNHRPNDDGCSDPIYDMAAVTSAAQAVFGVAPKIAPESTAIRDLLDGLVDPKTITTDSWHGILRSGLAAPRNVSLHRPPIIGRHSRDGYEKWPDADVIRLVYPVDGSREIRVLGGVAQAARRTGLDVETAWTVYPFGSLLPNEFLEGLDFWVYFHGPELIESFGMATIEALHAGLVVVLPHYMESTFSDAAVYASPHEALGIVDQLWADPDAYQAQSALAIRRASEWFGPDALVSRVKDLGVAPITR